MIKRIQIPKEIHEFIKKSADQGPTSFLTFIDWLSVEEHKSTAWIIVAREEKEKTNDFFTLSALASASDKNREKLLKTTGWEIGGPEFGRPDFYTTPNEENIIYDPGTQQEIRGITFRPFVFYREFHGYIPNKFELLQNFIHYHKAFFVAELNEYQRIDDTGELLTVIKIENDENTKIIKVDTHHLKDYLAAANCFLVRYHDHRRMITQDITNLINGSFSKIRWRSDSSSFELWLRTDIPWDEYLSRSRLLGKDLVFPYSQPDKHHTSFLCKDDKKEFVSFIVGVDSEGNVIEKPCDQEGFSRNLYYLTPVFFNKKVLIKYYQEPRRYHAGKNGVSCLNLWSIETVINEEGYVQAYLGDLGHIPYKEQLHWKQFNVVPKGGITEERWLRDFMAKPVEPKDDPIYYFQKYFFKLQKLSEKTFGERFFLALRKGDEYKYNTLRIPLTEEPNEFDEQLLNLAKILPDSINVALLGKITKKSIGSNGINGSIDLLKEFLTDKKVPISEIHNITRPFHIIQTLRSTAAAHRKGSRFEKALAKFNMNSLSNSEKIKRILEEINRSLILLLKYLN